MRKETDCLDKGQFIGSPDIMEASELLYKILNTSYRCSGSCLERDINGSRETVQSLYWKCKELMEQITRGGEKTEFLSMSVLEQTFNHAYPLLLVSLQELVEGDGFQLKEVQRLNQIFKDNPYKAIWEKRAEQYRQIIEQLGFCVSTTDYSDLTAIMDPLLDAFTFYQGRKDYYAPGIHKVRSGTYSNKRPEVGLHICKYRSEKELVDAVAECGKECVIMFGAVEKTNRQVTDGFSDWYYGYPEERQRNFMSHFHMDTETYFNQVAEFSRCIYLCVKSADTIWLVTMPYHTDNYHTLEDSSSKYYAGRRAGYAPYEIFYKDIPAEESSSTFLTVPKKGYSLAELMDEQQKVWMPVFIEETVEKFFRSQPDCDEWVLPEEITAAIPGVEGKSIIPVITNLPAVPRYVYEIKEPAEMLDEAYLLELCDYFHVKSEDILNAPILPVTCGPIEKNKTFIDNQIKKAYRKILAVAIAEFLDSKWEIRKQILTTINKNRDRIISQAADGTFDSFMTMVIDGTPKKDTMGNPIMKKSSRWPYKTIPSVVHTVMEDCKESENVKKYIIPKVLWAGEILSGKAPVVWKIRPKTAKEYALVLGIPVQELPDMLKLSDAICWFYKEYSYSLPSDMTIEWVAEGYGSDKEKRVSIYFPPLADINICMTKREYKNIRKKYQGKRPEE